MMKALVGLLGLSITLSVGAYARDKEPYCSWKSPISPDRIEVSDKRLLPIGADASTLIAKLLPNGLPAEPASSDTSEFLLAQPDYLIWYDADLRTPLWAAEHLTAAQAAATPPRKGAHEPPIAEARADSFRSDPRLTSQQKSTCADYKEPIFDQGHMVPNADLDFLTAGETISRSMDETFLMSNMTPQHCAFNRGPWQVLESLVRDWASQHADTWIITGAIFDRDGITGRDPDNVAWRMKGHSGDRRVAIPSQQYKIIVIRQESDWQSLALMLPNTDALIKGQDMKAYIEKAITNLAAIQQHTGIKFLEGLSVKESTSLWPVAGKWARPLTSRCRPSYPDY